jgi:hypothetical protein
MSYAQPQQQGYGPPQPGGYGQYPPPAQQQVRFTHNSVLLEEG